MRLFSSIYILFFFKLIYSQQGGYIFIENKNQWQENVKFKSQLKNGNLYVCNDGLTFDFFDEKKLNRFYKIHFSDDKKPLIDNINKHAYKVKFLKSNTKKVTSASQPSYGKYNYFIGKDQSLSLIHI